MGIDMIDEPKQHQSAPEKYASASVYGLRTKSHLPRRVGATLINDDLMFQNRIWFPKNKLNNNLPFRTEI
jgi:hypothetical protein